MWEQVRVARLEFSLKAQDHLRLPPYKGATLRGGFGHVFRRVACIARHGECPPCLLGGKCAYSYIFETPPPEGSQILRKYPHAPHPFVIEPPLDATTIYEHGTPFSFGLILIGRAIDYLPYFVYAFEELGRIGLGRGKGHYALEEVTGLSANGKAGSPIYKGRILLNAFPTLTGQELVNEAESPNVLDRITLHFLTPLRLKFEERLVPRLEFHILIRNLLRRLSLLSYFHCSYSLDLDFRGLIQRAEAVKVARQVLKWHEWERYSARQDERLKMGGLVGRIAFEGPLAEFLPFLRLGEILHVGKGTVFGLGKYRMGP